MAGTTDEKIVSVPYFIYEGEQTRMERVNHKLVTALVLAIILIFLSNALWLYAWTQYDYAGEESVITVDSRNGIANYVGNNGDIMYYAADSSDKEAQDTPKERW